MDTAALSDVDEQLDSFADEVFSSLSRKDRVATAGVYVRGLMLEGKRKSMQPMAERLGVDHQRLQQFVTTSPWDVVPVRKVLSRKACDLIEPHAWAVDDTGFAKDGDASPCVARQYSGTLGKVGNCQVAVSVHAVTDAASCPLNWRLFVPESWDDRCASDPATAASTTERRAKAAIPGDERYRPKWEMALESIDELIAWGRSRPPVMVADAGYGQTAEFRQGLTDRDLPYVVAVPATTTARPGHAVPETPPYGGRGPRPKPRYRTPHSTVKQLVLDAGEHQLQHLTWRHGTRTSPHNPTAAMTSRFLTLRIRPASRWLTPAADGAIPQQWLLAEWPDGATEPTDYWLSTLPADTPIEELVRLAKIRWRIEHDYRELKHALGLDHFEGRSWLGWHHHATLVTAAHLFLTTLRLTGPKAGGQG
ncbi:IS701 family transposase [Nocardia pseudovaccinii]|uniref:IS701 family transposase n=1 Tax=Nocardia pseudovaccinii TaxID=189540 RepID=UPI0007A44CA5|nr:IS701 family transposase [Nocardia pseudovaccinii]